MPLGAEARSPDQPTWVYQTQPWAGATLVNSHTEALWAYGEFCVFTMMWTVKDLDAGRVGRCLTCYQGNRGAEAFGQATANKCPDCYGTTFEGGFRAQVIRPAILTPTKPELDAGIRGQMDVSQVQLETTTDFVLHHRDYCFRANGDRYQTGEKDDDSLQEGFATEISMPIFAANVARASLEDRTSVAYLIPVLVGGGGSNTLSVLLDRSNFGVHTSTAADVFRPSGYLT